MDFGDETIFGLDLDLDTCDELWFQFITNKEWIKVETDLYTGKWFAYRFLHPVHATYIYAHHFEKIYRRYYRATIDHKAAEHIRIFKDGDFFKDESKRAGIWRGRQVADAAGMPYEVYLDLAFKITLSYWKQKHLPRPQQLYSDLVTDRIGAQWENLQEGFFYLSENPNYHNSFYKHLRSQDDHHEWLIEQAMKRGNAKELLHRLIYGKQLLLEEKVRTRFGDEFADQVRIAA